MSGRNRCPDSSTPRILNSLSREEITARVALAVAIAPRRHPVWSPRLMNLRHALSSSQNLSYRATKPGKGGRYRDVAERDEAPGRREEVPGTSTSEE